MLELGKNCASLDSLLVLVCSLPSSGFGFLAEGKGLNLRKQGWSLKASRLIRSVVDASYGVWISLQVTKDGDVRLGSKLGSTMRCDWEKKPAVCIKEKPI